MYVKHTVNHLKRDLSISSSRIVYGIVNSNSLGFKIFLKKNVSGEQSNKYAN